MKRHDLGGPVLYGDVAEELARRVVRAVSAAFSLDITPAQALIRPAAADRPADYQCNAAMGLAKQLGRPSREVASEILSNVDVSDIAEDPVQAGPGFINFQLRDDWLARQLTDLLTDPRLAVPESPHPRRFAIDYSSPNVAKEMHVGHLRSTVIGDALTRLVQFAGHEVIKRNHLGDWGTPFGMLLEQLHDQGWENSETQHAIGDLNDFYQAARVKFDADSDFADRARNRVVALQAGDPTTLELWRGLVSESERHFSKIYDLLDVLMKTEDSYGESFYNPFLADTVAELEAKGLTQISDGALCVFPPGFKGRDDEPLPMIIRKSDGGYNYSTTDLAAVRYWTRERGVTDLLYVVGAEQRQHFQMIFSVSKLAGWLDENHHAQHLANGLILGEDGRRFRTRSGDTIKLVALLNEAIDRANELVAQRSELAHDEQKEVAKSIGIGAIKYADLSSDMEKDYVFSWNRMLAMEGNTSVYLQYANARINSVLRKAAAPPNIQADVMVTEPAERALALKITQFPAVISATLEDLAPHKLCTYLFDTATAFSGFYENCPVLNAEPKVRDSRLALCTLTSRVLTLGLSLLGIQAPERL